MEHDWVPIPEPSISQAGDMTSAAAIPTVTLNDENTIPVVGLGVGELSEEPRAAG